MKLEFTDVHFGESLYCPTTNEVVFGPVPNQNNHIDIDGLENVPLYCAPAFDPWDLRDINYDATAFVGCWHDDSDIPIFKDEHLKNAWVGEFGDEFPGVEHCRNFLKKYNNPDWIALECSFYNELNEEANAFRIYVVKADCCIHSSSIL